jgi:hypothetical protein
MMMRPHSHLQRAVLRQLKWAVAAVAATPWLCHAAPSNNDDIFGQWRVVSVLDAAEITGVSEQRARSYIGKTVYIDSTGFRFQNMTCKAPRFARTEQETTRYLRESWHARSGNLGLPDRVTVVDARCTDIFIKASKLMVFNWKGYFLEAVKTAEMQAPQP